MTTVFSGQKKAWPGRKTELFFVDGAMPAIG